MTDLYLIRHGETIFNQQGCFQGHADSPLTPLGLQQAEKLVSYFSQIPLQHIYSSDLGRAISSATPLSIAKDLPLKLCPLLREISYGYLDGQPKESLSEYDKEQLRRLFSAELNVQIGEGETLNQVQSRLFNRINEIQRLHAGEKVAVMTHGLSMVMLLKKILHIPVDAPRQFNVHNVSVCHLTFKSNQWWLQSIERNDSDYVK